MTYKEIADMIAEIGLPNAYYEFSDNTEQNPPFVCFYFPESDDFFADNQNYVGIRRLFVELYADNKDFTLESTVENVLTSHGLTFRKSEEYITSERMLQTLYETEVIING